MQYARDSGIIVAKLLLCNGVPDRIFFVNGGKPLIIEFKDKKEEPEAIQAWYLNSLTEQGYTAHWVTTKEQFLALLEKTNGKLSTKNRRRKDGGTSA